MPQVGDYISDFLSAAVPSIISGVGECLSLIILEEETVAGRRRGAGERTGVTKTLERFVFQFHMDDLIPKTEQKSTAAVVAMQHNPECDIMDIEDEHWQKKEEAMKLDTQLAGEARAQLERSMRECLLRVLALRGRRNREGEKADNLSFKLCLQVVGDRKQIGEGKSKTNGTISTESCSELTEAMRQGDWFQSEESSCLFTAASDKSTGNMMQQTQSANRKGLLRPIKDVILPSCGMRMMMGMEVNPFEDETYQFGQPMVKKRTAETLPCRLRTE